MAVMIVPMNCTAIVVVLLATFALLLPSNDANALPSFARQTGMPCSSCHVQSFGPNLTPTGRNFKLRGYTAVKADKNDSARFIPPISAMIRGSFTHTNEGQPGGASERFGSNNNGTIDEAAVFLAGRIAPKIGTFIEGTYDGVEDKWLLDNTEIRAADHSILSGNDFVYGVSVNNSPTVSDLWNTTPTWGFPWASSELAPSPSAGVSLIDSLGGQLVGATAYTMWNNLLYVEGGGYTSLPKNIQKGIGTFDEEANKINGGAPYWRVALQKDWNGHYTAIGHFGMQGNVNPQRLKGAGTDQFTDFGFDITYQYLANPTHIFELNATYIHEERDLKASAALGLAEKKHGSLDVVKLRGAYTFLQTYSLNLGYVQNAGTSDNIIYAAEDPISGSMAGRPNSQAFMAEVSYTPFGKSTSLLSTLANLRLAALYTHYFRFNGGNTNYDGFGRNAAGNDSIYLNAWLAF
ncbi:cytochrome C [Nitrosomonas sp. Nm34]|uniref:cytochrome C n=1 Tax=Nitrosomonas sp. Nm34 TaxID=1881055 RepID=UPI0008E80493|nr:cytochrome C [Nitrosomonas sp. Nm34]SFI79200.1 hypothetical protein SAMN05428978_10372 [Nitrosomonas sp. Nm34]